MNYLLKGHLLFVALILLPTKASAETWGGRELQIAYEKAREKFIKHYAMGNKKDESRIFSTFEGCTIVRAKGKDGEEGAKVTLHFRADKKSRVQRIKVPLEADLKLPTIPNKNFVSPAKDVWGGKQLEDALEAASELLKKKEGNEAFRNVRAIEFFRTTQKNAATVIFVIPQHSKPRIRYFCHTAAHKDGEAPTLHCH